MKTCSIVVLYESNNKEMEIVDKVYIFDNYVESREKIVEDILS
jgi:rhamnosyltransferase